MWGPRASCSVWSARAAGLAVHEELRVRRPRGDAHLAQLRFQPHRLRAALAGTERQRQLGIRVACEREPYRVRDPGRQTDLERVAPGRPRRRSPVRRRARSRARSARRREARACLEREAAARARARATGGRRDPRSRRSHAARRSRRRRPPPRARQAPPRTRREQAWRHPRAVHGDRGARDTGRLHGQLPGQRLEREAQLAAARHVDGSLEPAVTLLLRHERVAPRQAPGTWTAAAAPASLHADPRARAQDRSEAPRARGATLRARSAAPSARRAVSASQRRRPRRGVSADVPSGRGWCARSDAASRPRLRVP